MPLSLTAPPPFRPAWPGGSTGVRLAGLAVAVLAAHLWLLQRAPEAWVPPPLAPATTPVRLLTRSLPAPVARPAAPVPTPPALQTAAAPPRARAVAPVAPKRPAEPAAPAHPPQAVPEPTPASLASEAPPELAPPTAPASAAAATATPPAVSEVAPSPTAVAHPPDADGPATSQAAAAAVVVPGPVALQYMVKGQAKGFQYSAHAELQWKPTATAYDARLEVNVFLLGQRVQTSSGRLTPQGLAPTRFADKSRNEQATHFQRDKGKISFSANTPDVALLPGAQDRLSVLMQLSALLAGDPGRYPAGKTIGIQTAGTREAEVWRFTVEGEEGLNLPYGTLKGLKLVRPPRHEFDQKVELWFAPALNFLPIRIKLTQVRGDFVDQLLEGVQTP